MLKKVILGAAASLTAMVALPASAEAQGYYGDPYYRAGSYGSYYDGYYRQAPRRYRPGDYYGGRYARRGYDRRYYDRGYYARGDRYYRGRRCGSSASGAIIGGAAGALVGREIARDGRRYYRRGNDGTVGAILGGAVGALIGSEAGRRC